MYPGQPVPPYQPIKPSHSTRNILLISGGILVATLLACGICTFGALLGGKTSPPVPVVTVTTERAFTTASPAPTGDTSPVMSTQSATARPAAMPNVVGKNAASAVDQLKRLGVTNVTLGSVDPSASLVILPENWTVAKQSVPPGDQVAPNDLVILGCRKDR